MVKEREYDKNVVVFGTFVKDKLQAVKILKEINELKTTNEVVNKYKQINSLYTGELHTTDACIFINLINNNNGDQAYMIFNNPPTYSNYIGGVGTINTVARGREHNPCVQYILISKKLIDKPDGEIYECLKFNNYSVNLDLAVKEIIELFKRLYVDKNEISINLTDAQYDIIKYYPMPGRSWRVTTTLIF